MKSRIYAESNAFDTTSGSMPHAPDLSAVDPEGKGWKALRRRNRFLQGSTWRSIACHPASVRHEPPRLRLWRLTEMRDAAPHSRFFSPTPRRSW